MTYKNTDFFIKHPVLSQFFKSQNMQMGNKIFLAMFNFQYSQNNQQEFEQLPNLFLKYSIFFAISETDVGKMQSPLHLPPKSDARFKKQQTSKLPIHLQDKVDRLLDILEYTKLSHLYTKSNNRKKSPSSTSPLFSLKANH